MYIHAKKILHRDLKTQNIFIARGGIMVLGDFGISKVLEKTDQFATTVTGTPYYMCGTMQGHGDCCRAECRACTVAWVVVCTCEGVGLCGRVAVLTLTLIHQAVCMALDLRIA